MGGKRSKSKVRASKLVFGVGINDADYVTNPYTVSYLDGKRTITMVSACPFHRKWKNLLQRCYSKAEQERHPSYVGCFVIKEWLTFSNFKAWMERQDWQGKELDKDLLVKGNKEYGPNTCLFIDHAVNSFLTDRLALRGELPVGVSLHKRTGKYQASCRSIETRKQEYLGLYETPVLAHEAYSRFKYKQANILASRQTDPRISDALISRYKNYD